MATSSTVIPSAILRAIKISSRKVLIGIIIKLMIMTSIRAINKSDSLKASRKMDTNVFMYTYAGGAKAPLATASRFFFKL